MTQRWAVWLLSLVLSLHNLEEAVLFPGYLPRVLSRLPAGAREWIGPIGSGEMVVALVLATAIPLAFSLWGVGSDALGQGPECGWIAWVRVCY